jgi:hypothetical protein
MAWAALDAAGGSRLYETLETRTFLSAAPAAYSAPTYTSLGPADNSTVATSDQVAAGAASTHLTIVPTFDSTITSDPNAAAIESTINAAINIYQTYFSDPITVKLDFKEMTSGLGQSSTYIESVSYTSYLNALKSHATTANDNSAIASLPVQTDNPVDGNASIIVTTADGRALGLSSNAPTYDSTIGLNTSICNLSRSSISGSKYDLMAVAMHEMDEAMAYGTALNGSSNGGPIPTGAVWGLDLYRYASAGTRSFNTTLGSTAYFSIDGGTTNLAGFNQTAGGDFSDYDSAKVRVQNAFGTPGTTPDVLTELVGLDVLGYTEVQAAPIVTRQPNSVTTTAGTTVSFTAQAVGVPTPTVQWQLSTNGGTTFTNISGATSNTYSFSATAGENGYEYRAVFTNSSGSTTSSAATLTSTSTGAPVVTTNPSNVTVTAGANATFSAAASGTPTPTVQWQLSTNGGSSYSNISGATSTTYSIPTTASENGYRYRAVFTNSAGSATTTAATLTVDFAPTLTTNPLSTTVTSGQAATFTAAASGNPTPTVQWQRSTNGGTSFSNISGATSTTYSFTTSATQNGYEYRAVFTNSVGSATSTAATLTVNATTVAPTVTTNPSSVTITSGQTATFTAAASGTPTPTVQWQLSTNGGSSFTSISGATSTTYSFTAATTQNGYEYRAVFTNSAGSATTAAATLTVNASTSVTVFGTTVPVDSDQNVNDPSIPNLGGVELGLKFRTDVAGTVTGLRFYKGSLDTGAHTGELWSSTGTLLATATYSGETASGWQTVSLSTAVTLQPNTTYIVSYHTAAAYIAYSGGALAGSGIDNGVLHVLANGVDGSDGVYNYGPTSFPTTYNGQAPNYWVDVVFNPSSSGPDTVFGASAPAASNQNIPDPTITNAGGVELGADFTTSVAGSVTGIRFYKGSQDTGVHTGQLYDSSGNLLASVTFTNESASGWQSATFSSPVTLTPGVTYVIAYHTTSSTIAYTPGGLANTVTNGFLQMLGGSAVYQYGSSAVFPTLHNGQSPNYWVDVIFQPS